MRVARIPLCTTCNVIACAAAALAIAAGASEGNWVIDLAAQAQPATQQAPAVVAIRAGRLLDGTGSPPIDNAVVVVNGDRIEAVGPAASVTVPAGARIVDLSADTVMPGLINGHNHPTVRAYVGPQDPRREGRNSLMVQLNMMTEPTAMQAARGVRNLRVEMLSGVTTAYVVGELEWLDVHLKRAADQGLFPSPRLYLSGPWLTASNGYFPFPQTNGPEAMRRFVRKNVEGGAHHIKMVLNNSMITGPNAGRPFRGTIMTKEEVEAAVTEAHRLGVRVTVHASDVESERLALEAGADSLQHAGNLTPEILDLFVKQKAAIVSTAGAGQQFFTLKDFEYLDNEANSPAEWIGRARELVKRPPPAAQRGGGTGNTDRAAQLRAARERGIPIAVGNDNMVGLLHFNIYRLVESGFTPAQALYAATGGGAKALGIDGEVGTLARGKFADIISISGRPDQNIQDLEKVHFVMVGGRDYTGLTFR
jgi:imidazolonepropionase-like amidohydrolase